MNHHCLSGALEACHGPLPWAEVVRSLFAQAEKKVNLGIGAYRDESGKPWVLECVKAVSFQRPPTPPKASHFFISCNGLALYSRSQCAPHLFKTVFRSLKIHTNRMSRRLLMASSLPKIVFVCRPRRFSWMISTVAKSTRSTSRL